jgi:hypothetical protein
MTVSRSTGDAGRLGVPLEDGPVEPLLAAPHHPLVDECGSVIRRVENPTTR